MFAGRSWLRPRPEDPVSRPACRLQSRAERHTRKNGRLREGTQTGTTQSVNLNVDTVSSTPVLVLSGEVGRVRRGPDDYWCLATNRDPRGKCEDGGGSSWVSESGSCVVCVVTPCRTSSRLPGVLRGGKSEVICRYFLNLSTFVCSRLSCSLAPTSAIHCVLTDLSSTLPRSVPVVGRHDAPLAPPW